MRIILLLVFIAISVRFALYIWSRKGHRQIARGMRTIAAVNAVMAAYREGDYETGLQKTEGLKDGFSKTAEYCFFAARCCIISVGWAKPKPACAKACLWKMNHRGVRWCIT